MRDGDTKQALRGLQHICFAVGGVGVFAEHMNFPPSPNAIMPNTFMGECKLHMYAIFPLLKNQCPAIMDSVFVQIRP